MKFNKYFLLFLVSLSFLSFWAQAFPITDTVESNYALTAKEMADTSDWLSPRIYGHFWYDKPVMIYWLLALAMKLFGYSELAVRLVPATAGALGIVLIYWFVAKLKGDRAGIVAAFLLGTSLQYFIIAKLIITDMVLFGLDSAALAFFYCGYTNLNHTKAWYWPMYLFLGLAVLTKGPVGLILPGIIILCFLAWQKQWSELREMKLLSGIGLFGLVALPWYLLMYLNHGNDFIQTFFGVHNYLRATVSEHPRDNVWYYYPLLFIASTLPWTGVVISGILDGIRKIRQHDDLSLFLMIWIGVFFGFYSLMATKYPTYTFPILFPLVVLTASHLEAGREQNSVTANWVMLWPLLLWQTVFVVIGYRFLNGRLFMVFTMLTSGLFVSALWRLLSNKARNRSYIPLSTVILTYILFVVMVLPRLADYRSGKQLAQTLSPYAGYRIGTFQFYSTSAVYYSGNRHILIQPQSRISDFRNKSLSWFAKYTMPVKTLREFLALPGEKKLMVVPVTSKQDFLREAAGIPLEQITRKENHIFYQIKREISVR